MPGQVTCARLAKVLGAVRGRLLQPYCTVYMHRGVSTATRFGISSSDGPVAQAGAVQLSGVMLQVLQQVTISAPFQRGVITLLSMHQNIGGLGKLPLLYRCILDT
jgi:hypothetical protein